MTAQELSEVHNELERLRQVTLDRTKDWNEGQYREEIAQLHWQTKRLIGVLSERGEIFRLACAKLGLISLLKQDELYQEAREQVLEAKTTCHSDPNQAV